MVNNKDLDLVDLLFNPFDWDRSFYKFNREEKDMNPYSIVNTKDTITVVHNVLGINKEDLKLSKKVENHNTFIVIEGKTKDAITGKEYTINSRFSIDDSQLDMTKVESSMRNGLLYITIPYKKAKAEPKEVRIEIK